MFLTHIIQDFISNKYIYYMRDICYKCESHKLESNNFSNYLVYNGLLCAFNTFTINCLRGLVVSVINPASQWITLNSGGQSCGSGVSMAYVS